jgi:hypothetical protein
VRWLLVEWPTGNAAPVKYWLSNLPERTPIVELVRLARLRWRVEQDYRECKVAWAWIISRGAAGRVGTTTSPWCGSPTGSSPWSGSAPQSWWRRPDCVAAARPAASPARLLGRRLSPVPPSRAALATPERSPWSLDSQATRSCRRGAASREQCRGPHPKRSFLHRAIVPSDRLHSNSEVVAPIDVVRRRAGNTATRVSSSNRCCLGDNCPHSVVYGSVGSSQVRLGGDSGESGLVRCSYGLWNDRENDHQCKLRRVQEGGRLRLTGGLLVSVGVRRGRADASRRNRRGTLG